MIIDAKNLIAGRLATVAAKNALLGEKVFIINSEKAYITGNKKLLLSEAKRKRELGTHKGPYYQRMPDRYLKRIIRGMIPYKTNKGRNAFKNIRCFIGVPEEFSKEKSETIKGADISKVPNLKYLTVGEICKSIGAKL